MSTQEFEDAIRNAQLAVDTCPKGHSALPEQLDNLGVGLFNRFKSTKSIDNLEAAISNLEKALSICSLGHLYRIKILSDLSLAIQNRYRQRDLIADLHRALELGEAAVNGTTDNDPTKARRLSNLSNGFLDRFEVLDNFKDLDKAIVYGQKSIEATADDDPQLAHRMQCLGTCFYDRFRRTASLEDLEEAIRLWNSAVENTPESHPKRGRRFDDLAAGFFVLYQQNGRLSELENAIHYWTLSVSITTEQHPERAERVGNLGMGYFERYRRMRNEDDLEKGIAMAKPALAVMPGNHQELGGGKDKLALMLYERYLDSSLPDDVQDLREAISLWEGSVAVTPVHQASLGERLGNLGTGYNALFNRQTNDLKDLKKAIHYWEDAVKAIPEDHPEQARLLKDLGIGYSNLHRVTRLTQDQETACRHLEKSLYHPNGVPLLRLQSGRRVAEIAVENRDWKQSAHYLSECLELLPKIASPRISNDDLQFVLRELSGLGPLAASVFLETGKSSFESIQALERCRGVIASLMVDFRSDVSLLKERHPNLNSEYRRLREVVATSTFSSGGNSFDTQLGLLDRSASISLERMQDNEKLDKILAEIRRQPGFKRFQLPPTELELYSLAKENYIVSFNVTELGSHAFLITTNNIRALALPKLHLIDLNRHVLNRPEGNKVRRDGNLKPKQVNSGEDERRPGNNLVESMRWLWSAAVHPVLEELGLLRTAKPPATLPSVCWVGGGLMSLLPMHAAGEHQPGDTMNSVISSYSPTLKVLQFSQLKGQTTFGAGASKILVVAMHTTPGHHNLDLKDEIAAIQGRVGSSVSVKILESPTISNVLQRITTCDVAHFACHGICNAESPSKSALLLGKDHVEELTVGDLLPVNHQLAQVAYLSACSTAETGAHSLIDESIHLASTFQLIGFRHVIGTLWGANDKAAVTVAAAFYQHLLEDTGPTSVSRALHHAILDFKNNLDLTNHDTTSVEKRTLLWAPFIHMGP